jgi:uncharacterized protein YggE
VHRTIKTRPSDAGVKELTMKRYWTATLTGFLVFPSLCFAQVSGNVAYSQNGGKGRAVQNERTKRVLTKEDMPPSSTSTFVEANVLMNVRADQFVAVFGISQEGETVADCNRKMDETIKQFSEELKTLGVDDDARFVDFIAQNKIYGYEVTGEIAREKLVGFELKKNVSIRYKDASLLDKYVLAASHSQIFDLIKVDYIVSDRDVIEDKLMDEASRIIKRKANRYEKLLDIKLQPPAQVFAEKSAIHYPTDMYDSYAAFETEHVGIPANRDRLAIQTARKSRTFFFNGLDADGFDAVINPVVIEPVVQFTLYLKVKYEVKQIKAS